MRRGHAARIEHRPPRQFATMRENIGAREPDVLGDALMLLMEGCYYTRLTFPHNSGPIASIGKAARSLIDAHLRK